MGLVIGLTIGLVVGLAAGLVVGLAAGVASMIVSASIFLTCFGGVEGGNQDINTIKIPSQGVKNFLYSTISLGLVCGLISGAIIGLVCGLISGTEIGLLVGLIAGGSDYIMYIVLRILLLQNRCIPWNQTRFLNYADECLLLRKVGGSYIFIHQMLLEYFATSNSISSIIDG